MAEIRHACSGHGWCPELEDTGVCRTPGQRLTAEILATGSNPAKATTACRITALLPGINSMTIQDRAGRGYPGMCQGPRVLVFSEPA